MRCNLESFVRSIVRSFVRSFVARLSRDDDDARVALARRRLDARGTLNPTRFLLYRLKGWGWVISRAFCKRKHIHRSIACTRPRLTYCDGRKRYQHAHRTRSNDRPSDHRARARASRQSTAHTRIDMFATATTCKISAVPTARAQRRARRSVAVRAEGAEETAAPVAVRCASARVDRWDGSTRTTRTRGERAREGMRSMGKNSCRRTRWVDRRARGRPRATRGTTAMGRWARSRAIDTRAYLGGG